MPSLIRAFTVSKNVDEGTSNTLRAEALEDSVDSEIFARIYFSRIALKDTLVM